jgi:phosphoribosylformylglycinamidine synthase subunit PurSL
LAVYRAIARGISGKVVRSCHDLSDGGLAVAVAESCMGGRLGAELRLDALPGRASGPSWSDPPPRLPPPLPKAARALFAEDPGRLLVSIRSEDRERFERMAVGLGVRLIGEVKREPRLRATLGGRVVLDAALPALERAFKTPIA